MLGQRASKILSALGSSFSPWVFLYFDRASFLRVLGVPLIAVNFAYWPIVLPRRCSGFRECCRPIRPGCTNLGKTRDNLVTFDNGAAISRS